MRREAVAEPVAIVVIILVRYSADSTCDCDSSSSLVMFSTLFSTVLNSETL